jgi:uncharacterized membrane protein YccC
MNASQPAVREPGQPAALARPRNGLGVAALVIGVASLVAGISIVLFPLALGGAFVGLILAIIAVTRGRSGEATNLGQAIAGVVCCALALALTIGMSMRTGTWAASNAKVFSQFGTCIAQASDRAEMSICIADFAKDVRR